MIPSRHSASLLIESKLLLPRLKPRQLLPRLPSHLKLQLPLLRLLPRGSCRDLLDCTRHGREVRWTLAENDRGL